MEKYWFYYDEAYHDRKITQKTHGELNIEDNDQSDNMVSVFVGFNYNNKDIILKKFLQF